jgi:hypothetical protein
MFWEMMSTDDTVCLQSRPGEVNMEDQPEDQPENMNPDNPDPWNKREEESSQRLYLLITLLCLLLAYVVSGSAR